MKMSDIIATHQRLDKELRFALSTMERKDTIKKIKQQIAENQEQCPHVDANYNWEAVNNVCPYCGMRLK